MDKISMTDTGRKLYFYHPVDKSLSCGRVFQRLSLAGFDYYYFHTTQAITVLPSGEIEYEDIYDPSYVSVEACFDTLEEARKHQFKLLLGAKS